MFRKLLNWINRARNNVVSQKGFEVKSKMIDIITNNLKEIIKMKSVEEVRVSLHVFKEIGEPKDICGVPIVIMKKDESITCFEIVVLN